MKLPFRFLFAVLCAAMIAFLPFFLSSPTVLYEAQTKMTDEEEDDGETLDFGRLLFAPAMAEDAADSHFSMEETDVEDPLAMPAKLSIPEAWVLPLDFSIPPQPDPDHFTADGYEDASIRVRVEEREMMDSVVHAAYVEIADGSQLRTATAYGAWNRSIYVENMAKSNNAVIAMNGDDFIEMPDKKRFEVRMTQKVPQRNKTSKVKDTLIIDRNGDFHLFILSEGLADYTKEHGGEIVNAFMFGPALVVDGEVLRLDRKYDYNRTGRDPRSAIGQTGPLSYVMVIVEGRSSKSRGVTHEELAEIMLELGCVQAYNLDGGNTAEMIMIGPDGREQFHFKGDQTASLRSQSDIIYFATAVPAEEQN